MRFTTNNISFLKNIPSNLKVDMTSGWRHVYFDDLTYNILSDYLRAIGDNKIYLLIPLFATSEDLSKATLNLSEPFLVNNKSNTVLIIKFMLDQWHTSGFHLNEKRVTVSLKFKRVWFVWT